MMKKLKWKEKSLRRRMMSRISYLLLMVFGTSLPRNGPTVKCIAKTTTLVTVAAGMKRLKKILLDLKVYSASHRFLRDATS
jgi:hypothetical protein